MSIRFYHKTSFDCILKGFGKKCIIAYAHNVQACCLLFLRVQSILTIHNTHNPKHVILLIDMLCS